MKNIAFLKKRAEGKLFCAVVKENAYGHGLKKIARLIKKEVDYFAVANSIEAKELLKLKTYKKILLLLPTDEILMSNYIEYCVASVDDVLKLKKLNEKLGICLKVHLKINTGMNRLGEFDILKIKKILNLIYEFPCFMLTGVFTHFASSDENNLKKQNKRFKKILNKLSLPPNILIHSENTGAVLNGKKLIGNMVRCGIGIYGGIENENLKPVLTIKAKVLFVSEIEKGDGVSYDKTFVAKQKTRIACVQIGYADGLSRRLSNNWDFYFGAKKLRQIGNICMSQTCVEIDDTNLKAGDYVTVLGRKNSANEMAKKMGTIVYEVFTRFK